MSNVDDAVNQLIAAVADSAVYKEYIEKLSEVKRYPDLKRQIDEYRARNFQLQNSTDFAFDKLERFEKEYEHFRENTLVSEFLAAELAFCRMMQNINICVAEAIHFE